MPIRFSRYVRTEPNTRKHGSLLELALREAIEERRAMTSELRRPLDGIASSVGNVGRSVAQASKSTDEIRRSIDNLGKRVSESSAMQSVDLLTDDEIDELRKLVSLGDGAKGYAASRLESEAVQGMYLQLSDLGFIHCFRDFDGDILYVDYDPKANWAIARHDKLAELEARRKEEVNRIRDEDRKHSRNNVIIGWFLGLATAAIPYLVNLVSSLIQAPSQ